MTTPKDAPQINCTGRYRSSDQTRR